MDKAKVRMIWEKMCELQVFDDFCKGEFVWFMQRLAAPDSVWFELHVEGEWVGVLFAEQIRLPWDANVHIFFWDKKLRGRVELVQEMIRWLFTHLKLKRLATTAPTYAKATIKFIRRLGFIEEGLLRQSYLYKGVLYDEHLFGMLQSDMDALTLNGGGNDERRSTEIKFEERSDQTTEGNAEHPPEFLGATGR